MPVKTVKKAAPKPRVRLPPIKSPEKKPIPYFIPQQDMPETATAVHRGGTVLKIKLA